MKSEEMKVVFFLVAAVSFARSVDGRCDCRVVSSMSEFNDNQIQGKWYEIKFYEPNLNPNWFWVDYTNEFTVIGNGTLSWELRGRVGVDPDECFHNTRYLEPIGTPGNYIYIENGVKDRDVAFVTTDYETYLITAYQKPTGLLQVTVWGRASSLSANVTALVDQLIISETCLGPSDFGDFDNTSHTNPCP